MAKAKKSQKKGSRNGKKSVKKASEPSVWPLILGIIAVIVIIGALIILVVKNSDEYPTAASYVSVQNAFHERNVSEFVLPDLTSDFISGNYTLKELADKYPGFDKDIKAVNEELKMNDEVLATVNGYKITRTELNNQEALLPAQLRSLMDDKMVLDQMIDERLLIQKAESLGMNVSDEELNEAYTNLLQQGNLTPETLKENLASYGLSVDDLKEMLVKQILINKLFAEKVDINLQEPTEEEVRTYYDENIDKFTTDDQVTVKHILVATGQTKDAATAKKEAEALLTRYKGGEDFCALVTEASDDLGSKDTCGEYTFGRGYMVPEFENASFAMAPGETRIVQTQFGQHLILKVADVPGSVQTYDEVKEQIASQLTANQRLETYQTYIESLREEADIVNNLNETNLNETTPEETETPTKETTVTPTRVTNEESTTTESTTTETKPTTETKQPTESTKPSSEPVLVTATTEEPTGQPAGDLDACLTSHNVTLYVADWATSSMADATKYSAKVKIIDCSSEGPDCDVAEGFYPTWQVGEKVRHGSLSESDLAAFIGC